MKHLYRIIISGEGFLDGTMRLSDKEVDTFKKIISALNSDLCGGAPIVSIIKLDKTKEEEQKEVLENLAKEGESERKRATYEKWQKAFKRAEEEYNRGSIV